jgi:hypothetical protein
MKKRKFKNNIRKQGKKQGTIIAAKCKAMQLRLNILIVTIM